MNHFKLGDVLTMSLGHWTFTCLYPNYPFSMVTIAAANQFTSVHSEYKNISGINTSVEWITL